MHVQAVKDLIARVFRLQTEVSRLRTDVNKLGGPRDTVVLRQKVLRRCHVAFELFPLVAGILGEARSLTLTGVDVFHRWDPRLSDYRRMQRG